MNAEEFWRVEINTRNYRDNRGWVHAAEYAIQEREAPVITNFDCASHLEAASALAAQYDMELELRNGDTECRLFVPNLN